MQLYVLYIWGEMSGGKYPRGEMSGGKCPDTVIDILLLSFHDMKAGWVIELALTMQSVF